MKLWEKENSNDEPKRALLVHRDSVLTRRRMRAAYALRMLPLSRNANRIVSYFLLGGLLVAALVILNGRVARLAEPVSKPLSLNEPTRFHQLDRFHLQHPVRDRDTLWSIMTKYYGKPTASSLERLLSANPWLRQDPNLLKIGTTLKVPIG